MDKQRYHHKEIEKKWQKVWDEKQPFSVSNESDKPKYYVLDMFPYPSGAGLHVGHVEGYTATDILARYKRQKGFHVLHPMGWDSFGLPAEQYAVRTGTHPAITTQKNIDNYRRQLKSLGFSYDWEREFATSDPKHYKWTQWIFTKLYEKGLAYQAEAYVNYCPALGTVLANEEVEEGKAIEGGHPIVRKPLKQWVLKITAYAERLLQDLDLVDWPEHLKKLQRNWIGRSEGADVTFKVVDSNEEIHVFTTRHDTLFGATYMVLAPEHPLVETVTKEKHQEEVKQYCTTALRKSELDRQDNSKDKTGVFTGSYAINPVNGKEIPIWISDYVLVSYGTGAIMAVPAHDDRDFAFAKQYALPIIPVYDPEIDAHADRLEEGEDPNLVREEILQGHRCWPGEGVCINSHSDGLSLDNLGVQDAKETVLKWMEEHGKGKKTVNYKLRDWLFSRQRYWGEPFPILHFEDGTKRTLEVDELPLVPPEINDYKPIGDGRSPLAKKEEWVEVDDAKTGKKAKRETDTMPQWAGSCWYYLRFCDPQNDTQAWSPEAEQFWMPVDMYIGGVEHAVLHLLYSRFWHKVLYDCGLVHSAEPFQTLRNPGIIVARAFQDKTGAYIDPKDVEHKEGQYYHRETGEHLRTQVEKMSKSKLNGVSPDEIINEFGADSLRLYEMFMGPLEKEKIWNTDAVNGCRRFLARLYDVIVSDKITDETDREATKLAHRLVAYVDKDIELLSFNTAIARMMEFLNAFSKLEKYPKDALRLAMQAIYSFVPHFANEGWEILGGEGELEFLPYPQADEQYLHDEMITYIVQVNGKLRGRFDLPKDQDEETIQRLAKENPTISKHIDGREMAKVVFVPNRLVNFVTK